MKKIFPLNKKILFTLISALSIIGYSFVVFAAAPNGGYAPGTTLDPDCAPGDTDCVVSIGGLNPNSILYTNANGNTTTDNSFTRDAVSYETYIGRTYQNTLPGDLTLTLDPLFVEFTSNSTPAAFVPGEQLTFEDTNTNTTYTGVYSDFMYSINQPEIDVNTTFNGNGINDLNASADSDYSGPVPTTFTITIVEKGLPIYGVPNSYNGSFQIGETVIGSNSGATGTIVSTVHGLVLDNITGSFQLYETITGNSSGATAYNDANGNPTDVFSYDNGDISGIGIAGYDSVEVYNGSFYFNMNNSTGHEIGDQWTVDVTSTPFYIHIHKVSNISGSVQEEQLSVTGQTSNISIQAGLYAITPLGAPGDNIIFQNFSGPQPTISGTGVITAVNGNNYGIEMGQGSTYNIGDLAFINNPNGGGALALVSAANTDPITVDMSSGFSINSNIAGIGLRGSVFQQTDGTVTGVMGAIDSSSVGGQAVTLGSNISSTATVASSLISQTLDQIIQTVETAPGESSALTLTGTQFRLSTTYTDNPNPALESGFMSTFNQSTTLVPAWFVGNNIQKLPSDLGSSGYVLTTDGSGNLSWSAGGSGGSSPISINGSTIYSSGLYNTGNYGTVNIFLGDEAGYAATNASYSNFLGGNAGNGATNVSNSNFFGLLAGYFATNASFSNFIGNTAGQFATNAAHSNFFGGGAGAGATDAYYSNFIGENAGNGAVNAPYSNFLGSSAGYGATDAFNSNFFGNGAGYGATGAQGSNFFGNGAGNGATGAYYSNFLGSSAGYGATGAYGSNFLGSFAGYGATGAYQSNFFGNGAGNGATGAYYSNFFGPSAGYGATGAQGSNFFGNGAGYGATGAQGSNFFGNGAGNGATNASYSNFFGFSAGQNSTNAKNSIFIGQFAGLNDTVDNTGNADDFSILIGMSTSTGGYENSIAIGGSATNTASNQFMIGSTIRPINEVVIKGSGTCSIVATGISCSSDERLKTNIEDLSNTTLDNLLKVRTVLYNWNSDPTGAKVLGFLAQDLEQYYPQLVRTDSDGYKMVNYAQITPVLVEAIREMNLKIVSINDMDTPNTWRDALTAWFANVNNGITKLFADEIETKTLCVSDNTGDKTCITKAQLDQLLSGSTNGSITPAPAPSPDPTPAPDPEVDTPTAGDDTDPGTSNDEPVLPDAPLDSGESQSDTPPDDSVPVPTE